MQPNNPNKFTEKAWEAICEVMGAKIDVESICGKGSTFTFWFPEQVMI
ncbi:MAG: hypothetical protein AAGJ08_18540 [Cyanobacteria bacterium P01_H01_bin.35]